MISDINAEALSVKTEAHGFKKSYLKIQLRGEKGNLNIFGAKLTLFYEGYQQMQ